MATGEIDPERFIDQLRSDNRVLRWEPLTPDPSFDRLRDAPVQDQESLSYLHHNWSLPSLPDADSGRGLRGFVVRRFTRLTSRLLGPRLTAEQEMIVHLVRMTDALAKRCDELTEMVAVRQVDEAANQGRLGAW